MNCGCDYNQQCLNVQCINFKGSNNLYEGDRGQQKQGSIVIASQGQLLGIEDIIYDQNYVMSVKCKSLTGLLLKYDVDDFRSYLQGMDRAIL